MEDFIRGSLRFVWASLQGSSGSILGRVMGSPIIEPDRAVFSASLLCFDTPKCEDAGTRNFDA